MKCNDVYEMALALIDEYGAGEDSAGLRSRAPRLINAAAIGLFELDRAYRRYVLGESFGGLCGETADGETAGGLLSGETSASEGLTSAAASGGCGSLRPARDLCDDFPLCGRLAAACAYYLAAMLIRDENPAAAGQLHEEYGIAVAKVAQLIPAVIGGTRDYYA